MIGGMDEDANTRHFLSSSIPYYQDDQTWCVAVAKPEELWKNIFKLFPLLIWLFIIGIIEMIAIVLYIIIQFDNKRENCYWSLLASISLTLGLSTVYQPINSHVRFMFFFFLFYGLIFSSAFHSFLVNILSHPRYKNQIETIKEAIDAKFEFTGGSVTLEHYNGDDEVRPIKTIESL